MAEVAAVQPAPVSMAHTPAGAGIPNKPATVAVSSQVSSTGAATPQAAPVPIQAAGSPAFRQSQPVPGRAKQEPAANGATADPQNTASLVRKYSMLTGAGLAGSAGDAQNPDAPSQPGRCCGRQREGAEERHRGPGGCQLACRRASAALRRTPICGSSQPARRAGRRIRQSGRGRHCHCKRKWRGRAVRRCSASGFDWTGRRRARWDARALACTIWRRCSQQRA